ncbi:MAG: peptidoglycan-binding protein [Alphaproteobacteria bacterium]|nr:MAG: peptidoglycan-binding protein [Alphaproteobacteria bacterium]
MRTAQMRKEGRTRSADAQPPVFLLQLLGWTARDVVGFAVGALATVAIAINVLFMQSGSHPAPFFKPAATATKPIAAAPARRIEPILAPAPSKAAPPAMRTPGEIITDIQRELSRRGYYEGPLDGLYGPKTDAAIRDFEHALGLKPSTQPNDSLLQTIMRSPSKAGKGTTGTISRPPAARPDTALDPPAASPRIIAVQRALAEFGYGQIRANGIVDAETQRAIERFERERKLPITGQISDRVIRELTAATGRPLE